MSAKWRRTKKHSDRFRLLKAFSRAKYRKGPHIFRIRASSTKKHFNSCTFQVPRNCDGNKCREPQPLIDVLQENDEIAIVAGFAGFSRKDIRVHVKNQRLTLSAQTSDRRYYKSLNLPTKVIPNTIRTRYKNGVLEVRLKKTFEEKTIGEVAG